MHLCLHARRRARSRLRLRVGTIALFTAMLGAMAAILTPSSAEAAVYIWTKNGTGSWTDPANWLYAGGGPIGLGFPSVAADVASFSGDYTVAIGPRIPDGTTVVVGQIFLIGNLPITISGGPGATLAIASGSAVNATLTTIGNLGGFNHEIRVPMRLNTGLTLTIVDTADLYIGQVLQTGGSHGLTKRGLGDLVLTGLGLYTGPTVVEDGQLYLYCPDGPSIEGDLRVGNGQGAPGSAVAFILRSNQFGGAATVSVQADGALDVSSAARVKQLTVNDGEVKATSGFMLTVGTLAMTGGVVRSAMDSQIVLEGGLTAAASAKGPATLRRDNGTGALTLAPGSHTFAAARGAGAGIDLDIDIPLAGSATSAVLKEGAGTIRFAGTASNTYGGATIVREGRLELARDNATAIPGALEIGGGANAATVALLSPDNIANTATVTVRAKGALSGGSRDFFERLVIDDGLVSLANVQFEMQTLSMKAGRITMAQTFLAIGKELAATSTAAGPATITGTGSVYFPLATRDIVTEDGPGAIDLRIDTTVIAEEGALVKRGPGVALIAGTVKTIPVKMITSNAKTPATAAAIEPIIIKPTRVIEGTLLLNGRHEGAVDVLAGKGTLGGTGTLDGINASDGQVAPGLSPGRLATGPLELSAGAKLVVELDGTTAGSGYDVLDVTGAVRLGNATLAASVGFVPPALAAFTIINNDGTDPVTGTFAGLPEGAVLKVDGRSFTVTYRGGDGNDVVLTDATPMSYYLAEGATGGFFDADVLIANPNEEAAPVTLTFMMEGGSTVVERRVVPALSRLTVRVDRIAGLEDASMSVEVTSDNRLPLVVERSMFWDVSYYGGHTANALAQPETRWIFAEGFQGFFDTYILIANANAEETTATLTFLRENGTPVVKTVPVGPFARKTVYAGEFEELKGRAFGVVVEATRPVTAERAMYFVSTPERLWIGGHVNTGIPAPSTSWFHAEGATGGYFKTFILLSNPQDAEARVELRFLLDTGDVITRTKTIGAKQRISVNPAAEGDARLENAAVSTVVQSDVPIVSERSMYWSDEAAPFGEGHNSSGVDKTSTRWGLAEGRLGGPHGFDTFILLANPTATEAQVRVTYLREGAAPIVKEHTVRPTSRFNIDVKTEVPELRDSSFGARIDVTNGVPIAVERSLYWNANGKFWAGGTNALGTPLPIEK